MLELSASLVDRPVMSLRTGGRIATTTGVIISPDNLKIEGFYVDDKFSKETLVLLSQDIRDSMPQGLVVNDHDVLSEESDLVRLQKALKLKFELVGKKVITEKKKRIGKVEAYAVDNESMYIKKLYVSRNIIKSFGDAQLSVDRSQIIEVTDTKIIIKDPLQGVGATAPATT